eukprot:Pgem_evm1s16709
MMSVKAENEYYRQCEKDVDCTGYRGYSLSKCYNNVCEQGCTSYNDNCLGPAESPYWYSPNNVCDTDIGVCRRYDSIAANVARSEKNKACSSNSDCTNPTQTHCYGGSCTTICCNTNTG